MDRARETMLGEGLTACPVTLLFKDHKGWTKDKGTVPPTRHVAGGHVGMNLYPSEVVSDIVEPMVGNIEGGSEIISTEDMVGNVVELNVGMSGWNKGHAWDGVEEMGYTACGKCIGNEELEWNEDEPEWCQCKTCVCEGVGNGRFKIKGNIFQQNEGVVETEKYEKLMDGMDSMEINDVKREYENLTDKMMNMEIVPDNHKVVGTEYNEVVGKLDNMEIKGTLENETKIPQITKIPSSENEVKGTGQCEGCKADTQLKGQQSNS